MTGLAVPLSGFITVWMFLAFNIATPGPNVLNTIALAIGSGRAAGLASAAGVGVGIAIWCLGMSLGLSSLMQRWPGLRIALSLLACGLLVWFALRFFRAARAGLGGGDRISRAEGVPVRAAFLRSLAVNATNPKALTTWIAILAMFPVAKAGPGDLILLCAGACIVAFGLHATYALVFSGQAAMRVWLRAAPAINFCVAVFFLGFALRLAWTAFD